MPQTINRPQPTEYPEAYQTYMRQLPAEGDILTLLEQQRADLHHMLAGMGNKRAEEAYAAGKWTIKELLQHMLDSERIFAYRALCIARGEQASLPGFEENSYAANSMANGRTLEDILEEYDSVRRSSLYLFRSFTPDMLDNTGTANGKPVTVRGIIHVTAAHERHHLNILADRYLKRTT